MKRNKNFAVLFAVLGSFVLPFSMPSTSFSAIDGVTPAEELICDRLDREGVTQGLYGLCLAYCVGTDSSRDLASEDLIENLPNHSKKILESYNRLKTESDPQMPCATFHTESLCPAWTSEQRDLVGTYGYSIRSDNHQDGDTFYDREYDSDPTFGVYRYAAISVRDFFGSKSAVYYHYVADSPTGPRYRETYNIVQDLTQEQYDNCWQDIVNHGM